MGSLHQGRPGKSRPVPISPTGRFVGGVRYTIATNSLTSQLGEQGLRGEDPHAAALANGKQVLAVTRGQDLDPGLDRAGEDEVIGGVSGHRLRGPGRGPDRLHREFSEQRLGLDPSLRVEVELLGEDALQLDYHRVEEDQLEATVYRFLEEPARRSRCDEGGDQDVGVETCAQAQCRRNRSSSTKASVSSGPIPSFSARSRP